MPPAGTRSLSGRHIWPLRYGENGMIRCPHCDHGMSVKGLHAGTYTPRCPKCSKKFTITMASDKAEPVVSAAASASAGASATVAPPGTARPASASQTLAPEAPHPPSNEDIPLGPELPLAPATVARPGTAAPPRREKASPDEFVVNAPPKVYQQSVGRNAAPQGPIRLPLTGKLGGYELKRKLGQGGMGTVYLARQVSLDRDVAVKVLSGELAQDAQFVSRFVREAYAAAQLVHHNVVQIHDIGEEERNHFFSMEYVKGQSLADVIRVEGAVTPDTAAGYILQAARGLKMAHDQGMIHRDIKPENLLVSSDGIVKVADLGLVKRQGAQDIVPKVRRPEADLDATQTAAHSTMGTPAYMAPEQAEDAAGVDARADIYSLGCTLFALLTGRAPFTGKTAEEVLAAARKGEVPAPRSVNEKVPSELSRIARLMTRKRKEDRYANIGQVIHDLEQYLGVEGTGVFSPRQQHVEELEQCVKLFSESGLARLRRTIVSLFVVGVLLVAGLLIYKDSRNWAWATGCVGMLAMTSVFYMVIASVTGGSYFSMRLRQLAIHSRWRDWFRWIAIFGLLVLAIVALDLTVPVAVLALLSLILAAGFRFTIDEMVTAQRKHAVAHADDMFRGFRLKGLDEDSVRRFACEYSGKYWEEFFETVFGYEAKMDARQRWGRSMRYRPKYGAWRDPIIRWVNNREEVVRQEKERKHLLRVETRALEGQGVEEIAAARQAKRMAEMMMAQAEHLRERALQERDEPGKTLPPEGAGEKVQKAREVFRFDEDAERFVYKRKGYIERRFGGPTEWIFGPRMRFAMAAIILLGFLMWRYDNRAGIIKELEDLRGQRIDPTAQDLTKVIDTRKVVEMAAQSTRPLRVPAVPDFVCDAVGSWNGGVAGCILLIGSFMPNITIGIPLLAAALMALFGEYLPVLGDTSLETRKSMALFVGGGAALVIFLVSKRQA